MFHHVPHLEALEDHLEDLEDHLEDHREDHLEDHREDHLEDHREDHLEDRLEAPVDRLEAQEDHLQQHRQRQPSLHQSRQRLTPVQRNICKFLSTGKLRLLTSLVSRRTRSVIFRDLLHYCL
jgi:hypothetical protein